MFCSDATSSHLSSIFLGVLKGGLCTPDWWLLAVLQQQLFSACFMLHLHAPKQNIIYVIRCCMLFQKAPEQSADPDAFQKVSGI
jgi:hypothetical protein